MSDDAPAVFWSYTHQDEELSGGRVRRLAIAIQNEYSLLTGDDLRVFVDRTSIEWGDEWRSRIDGAIQDTTLFMPVITPRFFKSRDCRDELLKFSRLAAANQAGELVLPILFVEVSELSDDSSDELVALVAGVQYADWTKLRLADEASTEHVSAVNSLAERLKNIASEFASRPTVVPTADSAAEVADPGDEDDSPGVVDLLGAMELAFPRWQETIESFPVVIADISSLTGAATVKLQESDQEGKGFVGRLAIIRAFAAQLSGPADQVVSLGESYTQQLVELDPGVRTLINLLNSSELGGDERVTAETTLESIRDLVLRSREGAASIAEFIEVLRENARSSKDLRPVLNRIQSGMRSILDGQAIVDEWEHLIVAGGSLSRTD